MKKNILKLIVLISAACAICSCEKFLDSQSYTQANTDNFPARPADIENLCAAMYSIFDHIQSQPLQNPYMLDNLMSDDCNGAGGTNDPEVKAIAHLLNYSETQFDWAWECVYKGVYRANTILETVENAAWTDYDDEGVSPSCEQGRGEAYFVRAYFMFWAAQLWGNVPMPLSTAVPNPCPEEDAETVIFPQIFSDLYAAISCMTKQEDGHATKYAAEALLARAYLWYEGFYKKAGEMAVATPEAIALVEQKGVPAGTTLSKQNVIDYLNDCISNSGKSLVDDFRLLWNYSNKLTANDYEYVSDLKSEGKYWAGNGNQEELFQIRFSNNASWNTSPNLAYSNQLTLYVGLRCDSDVEGKTNGTLETFPFGQGWGQGVCSANFWKDWSNAETAEGKEDMRKKASILDCKAELQHYAFVTTGCEDAGYSMKKHIPVYSRITEDGVYIADGNYNTNASWWACLSAMGGENGVFGTCNIGNNMQAAHFADLVLIRLADVYLMHTELTGDATNMNKVRARAGLSAKAYSWETLRNERRWELATEGLRYQDLRRWSGTGAGEGSIVCKALDAQAGQTIWNKGVQSTEPLKHITCSWTERYTKTNGFIFKPYQQVILSQGTVNQNPGWDVSADPNAKYKVAY